MLSGRSARRTRNLKAPASAYPALVSCPIPPRDCLRGSGVTLPTKAATRPLLPRTLVGLSRPTSPTLRPSCGDRCSVPASDRRKASHDAARPASGRGGEGARAARGAAPLRRALPPRLGQRAPDALGVEVGGVDRGAGLLPPGLVQPAGVDAVEAELVDEPQHHRLGRRVVAGDRERDPPRGAGRLTALHEVLGVDVVECLDHRPAELPLDPPALDHAGLDRLDAAVPLPRVVVAGVPDPPPP